MIKININETTKNEFCSNVMNSFKNNKHLVKKKNKKLIFDKSLLEINILIRKKLSKVYKDISLEKLIFADYEYMKKIVEFIDNNKIYTKLTIREKDIFLTMYSRLNNAQHIKNLDINVCPYCNRNYIFNFRKNNSAQATAQLDHFFDKKTYPFFAVSMYNLVPSCATCNQRKSSKNENIFYPYAESFNDSMAFDFRIMYTDENFVINKDFFSKDRIKILYDIKNEENKVEAHMKLFNIKELYNEHKDIISELVQRRLIYSDSYISSLHKEFDGVFESKDEIDKLITCNYTKPEDINKRPLSKLSIDISKELGLIK